MQIIHRVLVSGTLAAVALTGVLLNLHHGNLPSVQAHQKDDDGRREGCTVGTLVGGYGLSFQGFGVRGPVPAIIGAFIPAAGVGVMNFDGKGGLTLAETTSFGGQIAPISTSGLYNVNADCTGSLDATGAATWNFVIVHDAKQILAINTTEGRVATVNLEKQ